MKFKGIYRTIIILTILILNVGCDQITKSIVRKNISFYDQHRFLDNHFTILKVENTGAFLSLGDNLPHFLHFILLKLLPTIALLGALAYVFIKKNLSGRITTAIVFCISGGIGNLYDRLIHGSVTDFMHIQFGALQTGVFNVADISIMIGFGLILLDGFLKRNEHKKKEETITV